MINSFMTELSRRKVLPITGAYLVIAWLVTEIAGFLLEQTGAPGWILRVLAIAFVVGFPVAVIITWVVQVEPGGKWTLDSSKGQGKAVAAAVAAGIALTAGLSWLIVPRIESTPNYPNYDPLPNSVAILPFLDPNLTPNEVTIGETLYIALSNGLNASRSLTQVNLKLKEAPADPASLGRRVRVMALLAGEILHSAGKTQVEMSLLDIKTGKPHWTRRFDWDATQIMDQGTEIANAVLQFLNLPAITTNHFAGTDSREAYDALLIGRRIAFKRFLHADIEKAIPHFERAIKLDSSFVLAHVSLANALRMYSWNKGRDTLEWNELQNRIRWGIETAQALDPESPDVISFLGRLEYENNNVELATELYKRALTLDPDHMVSLGRLAEATRALERWDEALIAHRRRVELDPLDASAQGELGTTLWFAGQVEEGRTQMWRALELEPGLAWPWAQMAFWDAFEGRIDRALYNQWKALSIDGFNSSGATANIALWYAVLGARDEAMQWAEKALEIGPKNGYTWTRIGQIVTQLGPDELAFGYADQSANLFPDYHPGFAIPNGFGNYRLLIHLESGEKEQAWEFFRQDSPELPARADKILQTGRIENADIDPQLLTYTWLLLETGEKARAHELIQIILNSVEQRCTVTTLVERQTTGTWCQSRHVLYGLLQHREETLAAMRNVFIEDGNRWRNFRFFEDHGALSFLQEDPEFQRIMAIVNDDLAAQLENVREIQHNGELPPPTWVEEGP